MNSNHLVSHSAVQALSRLLHVRLASTVAAACVVGLLSACGGGSGGAAPSIEPSGASGAQQATTEPSAASQPQALATEPTSEPTNVAVINEPTTDGSVPNNSVPSEAARADGGREANYFRLTKDTRRCAAPACGGVFATTLNTNVQITCPNGEVSATCYIGRLDTAALGYSPFDVSNGEAVKVKGTLTTGSASAGTQYGNLAVEKVFLPVGSTQTRLMHHLYVITNNGLVCETRPCLKYNVRLANRARDYTFSSFDLSKLGVTTGEARAFRRAINSGQEVLIQVGESQNIETENGTDVRQVVNALYMPVQVPSAP
jgi:hypothetical protein